MSQLVIDGCEMKQNFEKNLMQFNNNNTKSHIILLY